LDDLSCGNPEYLNLCEIAHCLVGHFSLGYPGHLIKSQFTFTQCRITYFKPKLCSWQLVKLDLCC